MGKFNSLSPMLQAKVKYCYFRDVHKVDLFLVMASVPPEMWGQATGLIGDRAEKLMQGFERYCAEGDFDLVEWQDKQVLVPIGRG